jgi:acyl-coenzyme A synthetase/AMP-(fatty) acid ligase
LATAGSIFRLVRERVGPYKRIRRLEFRDLPKTVSGKIRRSDLRRDELAAVAAGGRPAERISGGLIAQRVTKARSIT